MPSRYCRPRHLDIYRKGTLITDRHVTDQCKTKAVTGLDIAIVDIDHMVTTIGTSAVSAPRNPEEIARIPFTRSQSEVQRRPTRRRVHGEDRGGTLPAGPGDDLMISRCRRLRNRHIDRREPAVVAHYRSGDHFTRVTPDHLDGGGSKAITPTIEVAVTVPAPPDSETRTRRPFAWNQLQNRRRRYGKDRLRALVATPADHQVISRRRPAQWHTDIGLESPAFIHRHSGESFDPVPEYLDRRRVTLETSTAAVAAPADRERRGHAGLPFIGGHGQSQWGRHGKSRLGPLRAFTQAEPTGDLVISGYRLLRHANIVHPESSVVTHRPGGDHLPLILILISPDPDHLDQRGLQFIRAAVPIIADKVTTSLDREQRPRFPPIWNQLHSWR